jgi:hypothetical protein
MKLTKKNVKVLRALKLITHHHNFQLNLRTRRLKRRQHERLTVKRNKNHHHHDKKLRGNKSLQVALITALLGIQMKRSTFRLVRTSKHHKNSLQLPSNEAERKRRKMRRRERLKSINQI